MSTKEKVCNFIVAVVTICIAFAVTCGVWCIGQDLWFVATSKVCGLLWIIFSCACGIGAEVFYIWANDNQYHEAKE